MATERETPMTSKEIPLDVRDDVRAARNLPALTWYWCDACDEQSVPSLKDGSKCVLCGAEQWEPMRVGWDESD
jgi:hypothetical protein